MSTTNLGNKRINSHSENSVISKSSCTSKKDEAQVIIKKGGRTVEILTLSHTEVDRWLQDIKSDQQNNMPATSANY